MSELIHEQMDVRTYAVVHSLVDAGPHPSTLVTNHGHLGYLESSEVAEAQLDELALLVELVDLLERLREIDRPVGCVQIKDINAVRLKLRQIPLEFLSDILRSVATSSLVGIVLGGQSEATFLPFCFCRESLLFCSHVRFGRVHFVVSLLLEVVEAFVEVVQRGDTSPGSLIWPECHEAKDDLAPCVSYLSAYTTWRLTLRLRLDVTSGIVTVFRLKIQKEIRF